MMLAVMLHLVNAELRVILNLYLKLVMSGKRAPLQDTGLFDINGRSFLVFMTLVIFQIILDGHFAIILPIFVQDLGFPLVGEAEISPSQDDARERPVVDTQ
ncbi:hypothetical protein P3S68_028374 [Capsicum galapagoense]